MPRRCVVMHCRDAAARSAPTGDAVPAAIRTGSRPLAGRIRVLGYKILTSDRNLTILEVDEH